VRSLGALLIASVLLPAGANAPVTPVAAAADDPLQALAHKIFSLANRQRRLHGVRPLEWNDTVAQEARRHSMNMMERGFFSHTDPARGPLGARLHAARAGWSRCGENIFREQGMDDPADAAIEGWMRSPAHRQGLLDPLFTQTGVGIAISPDTEYFITQEFIHPLR
jgi:uncharacterized protein YkwD